MKKYQDVDDDDLHFMQKALLIRRPEASTHTLHRNIVIIIIIIIITVVMMTKCFACPTSAENSEALSHVETSLLFLNECKNFRTFNTLRFFFSVLFRPIREKSSSVSSSAAATSCLFVSVLGGFVVDTADKKLQRGL